MYCRAKQSGMSIMIAATVILADLAVGAIRAFHVPEHLVIEHADHAINVIAADAGCRGQLIGELFDVEGLQPVSRFRHSLLQIITRIPERLFWTQVIPVPMATTDKARSIMVQDRFGLLECAVIGTAFLASNLLLCFVVLRDSFPMSVYVGTMLFLIWHQAIKKGVPKPSRACVFFLVYLACLVPAWLLASWIKRHGL